ncbi:hypothetical protein ACIG6B_20765 [Bacillus mobilis]|uniref:hypothetical protein n=1 Tax=Bacillus mobilis TaxID=2026190 RepID=UPI00363B3E14
MPKILNPKDVTGTTRFNLDFELKSIVVLQLAREFETDYPDIRRTPESIKLVDPVNKKGMEISESFISFFPVLRKTDAEKVRERIYKHIAKKSEVYYSTSRESMELSITSLLAEDIRSCASLLYYSLHKFINGAMYSYLNNNLDLEDYEIGLAEVEHFTSANFYSFSQYKNEDTEIDEENYKSKFCIKNNSADPFLLMQYITIGELSELEVCLLSYIKYVSNNLFGQQYDDVQFKKYLTTHITDFLLKKKERKKVSQEEEVRASIAFALEKTLHGEENKFLWMLYVLSLRLYWLRQTADYEFDFEVKTSVREMSILLFSVKSFLDLQLCTEKNGIEKDQYETSLVKKIKDKEKLEEPEQDFTEKNDEKKDRNEVQNNKKYSVDIKFPTEIHIDHEVTIFLTALHLDPFFNKDEIIFVLNLTEYITNKGKYFIFKSEKFLAPPLYIYINDDGRWSAWFKKTQSGESVNFTDLTKVFDEFLYVLRDSYKESLDIEFSPKLIYSIPMHVAKPEESLDFTSLININKSLKKKKESITEKLVKRLGYILKTPYNKVAIKIGNLAVEFNLIFNSYGIFDVVPYDKILLNKYINDTSNRIIINLIVGTENQDKQITELIKTSHQVYMDLLEDHNMEGILEGCFFLGVPANELEVFINKINREHNLLTSILSCLNSLAYSRAMSGKIDETYEIVNKYSGFVGIEPYALATRGLLYLRDSSMSLDESEKKGKEYYNKAINLDHDEKEKYIKNLEQKYNFEMARFYFVRKTNYQECEKYLRKAIDIGENGVFYADSLELYHELLNYITQEEVSTTIQLSETIDSELPTGKEEEGNK